MTVDDNLIAKLAKLSSLEIDDSRKEKLKSENSTSILLSLKNLRAFLTLPQVFIP